MARRDSPGRAPGVRFLVTFVACALLGFALLVTSAAQALDVRLCGALARVSHTLIVWCGGHAWLRGAVLGTPNGDFAVEMKDGCNGVNVTIFLWSAILAFPAPWKKKLLGMLAGGLAIQSLNIVRFISLFYLGQYSSSWFEFAHRYLWESLLILTTMAVFWTWANRAARSTGVAHGLPAPA